MAAIQHSVHPDFFGILQGLFTLLIGLLFVGAIIRWAGTRKTDPERRVRGDMALLFALGLVGMVGAQVRSRYLEGTIEFWVGTAALLPVGVGVLLLLRRLLRYYREAGGK